jgi:GDPmannose 4,6-dehydratase
MHSVREFVEASFRHVGKEIEWEGKAEAEVGKEKGTDIVRVRVNAKYYRPTEVEQLQVSSFFFIYGLPCWQSI